MKIPVAALMLSAALVLATGAEARDRIADSPHMRPATPAAAAFVSDAAEQVADRARPHRKAGPGQRRRLHSSRAHRSPATRPRRCGSRAARRSSGSWCITIGSDLPADRQMALLGHELQHVAEIARVTWVSSQADVGSLFALIGWRDATQAAGYETSAALAIERQVARELGRRAARSRSLGAPPARGLARARSASLPAGHRKRGASVYAAGRTAPTGERSASGEGAGELPRQQACAIAASAAEAPARGPRARRPGRPPASRAIPGAVRRARSPTGAMTR